MIIFFTLLLFIKLACTINDSRENRNNQIRYWQAVFGYTKSGMPFIWHTAFVVSIIFFVQSALPELITQCCIGSADIGI